MFYLISKLIGFLVSPFYWILICLILVVAAKSYAFKKKVAYLSLIIFVIFSNQAILGSITQLWAVKFIPINQVGQYDVGIVLGGASRVILEDTNRVFLNAGSGDRIMHSVHLYKIGKIKKILFTGGAGSLFGSGISEATQVKKLYMLLGIPQSDLIFETQSRTTYENALFSSEILKQKYNGQKYLLISNSVHLKRGLGCFEKLGTACDTFPIDNENGFDKDDYTNYFLPKPYILLGWDSFFHELIGYMTYKIQGYC